LGTGRTNGATGALERGSISMTLPPPLIESPPPESPNAGPVA
jgi:hypothetical protein